VLFAPLSERKRGYEFHEVTLWPGDNDTIAWVEIFNVISFLAKMPNLGVSGPTRFVQQTRSGKFTCESVADAKPVWQEGLSVPLPPEYGQEHLRRINEILMIGECKGAIQKIIEKTKATSKYAQLSADDKKAMLERAVKQYKPGHKITSIVHEAMVDFATRKILLAAYGKV